MSWISISKSERASEWVSQVTAINFLETDKNKRAKTSREKIRTPCINTGFSLSTSLTHSFSRIAYQNLFGKYLTLITPKTYNNMPLAMRIFATWWRSIRTVQWWWWCCCWCYVKHIMCVRFFHPQSHLVCNTLVYITLQSFLSIVLRFM